MGRPFKWTAERIEKVYFSLRKSLGRPPSCSEFMEEYGGAYKALYNQNMPYAEFVRRLEREVREKSGADTPRVTKRFRNGASQERLPKCFSYYFQREDNTAETRIGILVYRISETTPVKKGGSTKIVHFVGICEGCRERNGRIEADMRGAAGLDNDEKTFVINYLSSVGENGEINFL